MESHTVANTNEERILTTLGDKTRLDEPKID